MAMRWDFLADGSVAMANLALNWLVQSCVLLAAGLAAGRALRRYGAAVQSVAYRTTLVAVLLCPIASALLSIWGVESITIQLPRFERAQRPATGVAAEDLASRGAFDAELRSMEESEGVVIDPRRSSVAPGVSPGHALALKTPSGEPRFTEPTTEAPTPILPTDRPVWQNPLSVAVWLGLLGWLAGLAVLMTRLVVGHCRMSRLRLSAVRAEPVAEDLCRDLADRMDLSPPLLLRTPFLPSPCLDGLWRPAILLPEEDGEINLRETLVHELAHLARRDPLWNLLRRVATAALWGQPLLWVLSRRMEAVAEEVCDDVVVQFGADRARYAGLLLHLAERTLPPHRSRGRRHGRPEVPAVAASGADHGLVPCPLDESRSASSRRGPAHRPGRHAAGGAPRGRHNAHSRGP